MSAQIRLINGECLVLDVRAGVVAELGVTDVIS